MTPHSDQNRLLPTLLITLGLLFLARNLGWLVPLGNVDTWIGTLLFAAGGTAFLFVYHRNHDHWWAFIPSFALYGLAAATMGGAAAGGRFLGLLATGFLAVYVSNRQHWWAIIPGGVLLTLGTIAWLNALWPAWNLVWLFFLGIAATFATLYALPETQGKQPWAIYPVLGSLALVALTLMSSTIGNTLIAILLIAGGAHLLWRRTNSRPHPTMVNMDHDREAPKKFA